MIVIVRFSTPQEISSSNFSSTRSPFELTQSTRSGYFIWINLSVSNVSLLYSGSPGPAIPATRSIGFDASASSNLFTASSGSRTVDVIPGLDSLAQSYFLSQYLHLILHFGATGKWIRPNIECASWEKQGCSRIFFLFTISILQSYPIFEENH